MFKFFKKSPPGTRKPAVPSGTKQPAKAPQLAARRPSAQSRPGFLDRLPVPEVTESADESAWDDWEHSQMEMDSKMGALSAYDSIKVKDASPSKLDDLDPFTFVRRRR